MKWKNEKNYHKTLCCKNCKHIEPADDENKGLCSANYNADGKTWPTVSIDYVCDIWKRR